MKTTLREKVSAILGFRIEPGRYSEAFKKIDMAGYPSRKQVNLILVSILEELDHDDQRDTKSSV